MDEPVIVPADEFYLRAFFELNTGRPSAGFGVMPLPWNDILMYAEYVGLEREIWSAFTVIIRALDTVFIKWLEGEKVRTKDLAEAANSPPNNKQRRS